MKKNKIKFTTDARTIFQLGKEAIANEILAISELVKNAYDADATQCILEFEENAISSEKNSKLFDEKEISAIKIIDNGTGMSYHDILNNWLRIGTNNKEHSDKTKKNRTKVGEKGIGRLAINRLGYKAIIYSKKQNETAVRLEVDFEKFTSGKNLEDVEVDVKYIQLDKWKDEMKNALLSDAETGTVIRIERLLDGWTKDKIENTKKEVLVLQNPFSKYKLDNENNIVKKSKDEIEDSFEIIVSDKEISSNNSDVDEISNKFEKIVDYSLFRMNAQIDTENNTYTMRYTFKPYQQMKNVVGRNLFKKDSEIIIYEEKKPIKLEPDEIKFGIIDVNLFAYDFSAHVKKDSPFAGNTNINKLVKNNGGVKVYRDNQRVYNYGEPGTDWLGLDSKRINNPGRYLSNNVLIGNVYINKSTSNTLIEKTNREGFIDGQEFERLRNIIQTVVFDFSFKVGEDKNVIKKIYQKTHKKVNDDEEYEKLLYKIESIESISHFEKDELKEGVYLCQEQMNYIKNVLFNVSINAMDYLSIFHDLEKDLESLRILLQEKNVEKVIINNLKDIEFFVQNHNDLIRDKKKKKYILNTAIIGLTNDFEYRLKRKNTNLSIDLRETEGVEYIFNRSSIRRILQNIFSNSMYWISTNTLNRNISITSKIINDEIIFIVDDNGPGFQSNPEYLREPFITSKVGNEPGIGLGLYIIDELMKNHGGYAVFNNESNLRENGARVELHFPIK